MYHAKVIEIIQETPTVKSFVLDLLGEKLAFSPGQYIDLYVDTLEGSKIAGYSITSSPLSGHAISIAVKLIPGAAATVHLHERTVVGDEFDFDGPGGDFCYEGGYGTSATFIAGGIGVTPFMSMIRFIIESRVDSTKLVLIYSAKKMTEIVFLDELERMSEMYENFDCYFAITGEDVQYPVHSGRIDFETIELCSSLLDTTFFVSGPKGMSEDFIDMLVSGGVDRSNVRSESW